MISLCLAAALGAANAEPAGLRPTVAVAPAVSETTDAAWLGLALADSLTTRLLIHSRYEPKRLERVYPLNVFGWRQVASAARGEALELAAPLSDATMAALEEQLGADYVFAMSYKAGATGALVSWRMFGGPKRLAGRIEAPYDGLSAASEKLAVVVLQALGQDPAAIGGHKLETLPLAAMKPFGEALLILANQSLDPRAQLVLSPNELRQAHDLLSAATDAAPGFARAWVERGIVSSMLGDLKAAEDEFVQAMAQSGEFEPWTALGLYYFYDRQGKTEAAVKVLEEATSTHLGFLQGLGYLGEAYGRASMNHESLQTFTSYAARVPKSPWAQVRRAAALSRLGKHDVAVEEMQALRHRLPHSIMVLTALASRQLDAQDFKGALGTLADAAKLAPKHPVILTRLSFVALETGRPEEALALAQQAVNALGNGRGEPLAGYAHLNLAHALAVVGRRNDAITALKRAQQLGIGVDDVRLLTRDPRLKELLSDPRSPIKLAP